MSALRKKMCLGFVGLALMACEPVTQPRIAHPTNDEIEAFSTQCSGEKQCMISHALAEFLNESGGNPGYGMTAGGAKASGNRLTYNFVSSTGSEQAMLADGQNYELLSAKAAERICILNGTRGFFESGGHLRINFLRPSGKTVSSSTFTSCSKLALFPGYGT